MKTSDRGIEMIKAFEGLRLEAYRCAAGVWTIGYGHTYDVKKGQRMSPEEAEDYLRCDLGYIERNLTVMRPLRQNQFDALVSFVFNVGISSFKSSTLRKMVMKNPDDKAIYDEILKWKYITVNGVKKVLPGLEKRRIKEAELYFAN